MPGTPTREPSAASVVLAPGDKPGAPPPPSVDEARARASAALPKDPTTGKNWTVAASLSTSLSAFQSLSLGTFTYMSLLQVWFQFYVVILLLSISNGVHNAYGHMLDEKASAISFTTFLFTFTSLGNAEKLAPAYGATELTIACLMTAFLYYSTWYLRLLSRRAERLQITPADFAVMIEGLPRVQEEKIEEGIKKALSDPEVFSLSTVRQRGQGSWDKTAGPFPPKLEEPIGVALSQREILRACTVYEREGKRLRAQDDALATLNDAKANDLLGEASLLRRDKLEKAVGAARKKQYEVASFIEKSVNDPGAWKSVRTPGAGSPLKGQGGRRRTQRHVTGPIDLKLVSVCAGSAFVSLDKASDAVALIKRGVLTVEVANEEPMDRRDEGKTTAYACRVYRPPEPSDIIWENIECEDGLKRQVKGTLGMTLLSFSGTAVIAVTSFLQPAALNATSNAAASAAVGLLGTIFVVGGYLVVFLVVPNVEENYMRHKSVTAREVSTVLKLVAFQVLATIATASVFVLETGGSFNRDWYILGGFILVNGMIVDFGFITCVVQGWNIGVQISRRVGAPYLALTQYEANEAYAVKADGYVIDRLQMVTKFVVMTYIYSSAMPLLWGIVVAVLLVSMYFDSRNLLRVFQPPPQSDESAAKAILIYVMPLAVLGHLLISYVMLKEMGSEVDDDWLTSTLDGLSKTVLKVSNVSGWGHEVEESTVGRLGSLLTRANRGFNVTAIGHDVIGSFGEPEDDAVDMAWLSVLINTPLVVLFIFREWGREWGRELPMSRLLRRTVGVGLGLGGTVVKTVATGATKVAGLAGGAEMERHLRGDLEGLEREARAVYSEVENRFDEEHAWADEETRRRLADQEEEEEIDHENMIKLMNKQGFLNEAQLYYDPPDRTDLIRGIVDAGKKGSPFGKLRAGGETQMV